MKTRCGVVVLCLCFGITCAGFAQEAVIKIASGEYVPWTSASIPHGGFVNHVITEAFQREGYSVSIDYFPWKRAYHVAKSGEYQATSFWSDADDYLKDFYRSNQVIQVKVVFFHLRAHPMQSWETLADLHIYRIGAMLGETSTKELERAGLSVETTGASEEVFKMMLADRIDIFPLEVVTGLEFIKTIFSPEQAALIAYDPKPMFESPGFLLVSKQVTDGKMLVTVFNRGLASLRKDGRYEQLYQDFLAGAYRP